MIYFVGNKQYDWVKIGVTIDMTARLSGIQSCCPVELTVLRLEEGGQSVEQRYHALFHDVRIRGEWFRLSGSIQEYLDSDESIIRYERPFYKKKQDEYKDIIISSYLDKISIKIMSETLGISKSIISRVISTYKNELAIKDKLNQRMYIKLNR